jgi:hypothetical protein
MQLSGTIFKGQHDSLLGTELLFTEGKGNLVYFSKDTLSNSYAM